MYFTEYLHNEKKILIHWKWENVQFYFQEFNCEIKVIRGIINEWYYAAFNCLDRVIAHFLNSYLHFTTIEKILTYWRHAMRLSDLKLQKIKKLIFISETQREVKKILFNFCNMWSQTVIIIPFNYWFTILYRWYDISS